MIRWLALLGLFLGLASCRSGDVKTPGYDVKDHIQVFVDKRFSPEAKGDIHDAIADWNRTLANYASLDIATDEYDAERDALLVHQRITNHFRGIVINYTSSNSAETHAREGADAAGSLLGWINQFGGSDVYLIMDRVEKGTLHKIVQHELGHYWGARHSDYERSIMYPSIIAGQIECIDRETATHVAAAHWLEGWHAHDMYACDWPAE